MNQQSNTTKNNSIPIDELKSLIDYDPLTGILIWKHRDAELFSDDGPGGQEAAAKIWNKRYEGKPALNVNGQLGYLQGRIFGINFKAHRVAFALHFGLWPIDQIDHIDCNPSNNKICNLREATSIENGQNRKPMRHCLKGAFFNKKSNKWISQIRCKGVYYYLGIFTSKEEAHCKYKEAATNLHGKFARFS